jgi:cell division transport system ATP-binding protein
MELFAQFNRVGVTLLVATHDVDLIQVFDKRIIQLRHGRVADDQAAGQP